MEHFELINHAKKLMSKNQYKSALKPLFSIPEQGPSDDVLGAKYILLSACYYNLPDYTEALAWANKAVRLNKDSEFASFTKYNIYRKMNQQHKAVAEMKTFLSDHEPLVYYTVLAQLLAEIETKAITDPELINCITQLARKHELCD